MPRIPLSEARPGQKLSRPAATRAGVVMVQAGTELTSALIERLRFLGIDTVSVHGEVGGAGRPLEEVLAAIDARFAGHEGDAWMMALKEIVVRQAREQSGTGDHG